MKSAQTKLSIVFCHGIWADGSCFSKVIPPLQAEGHEVIAAQYGLDTNEGDVAMVKRALGRVSSPAILVGHSYGGSVITAAGTDDRVAGLVYIAAVAPDAGENDAESVGQVPGNRRFLSRRSGGRSSLVTPFRPGVLRWGSFGGGPEACLGNTLRAGR
jgi:pimeloyl-ACP methyl ester carboxylesterase